MRYMLGLTCTSNFHRNTLVHRNIKIPCSLVVLKEIKNAWEQGTRPIGFIKYYSFQHKIYMGLFSCRIIFGYLEK